MKIEKELKQRKIPIVAINKSLNTLDEKIIFPDKLDKANQMLKRIGLPKVKTVK
ncbi:hypothetical protein [Capnocytophaga sp.]|uniref:hypothetical protein n=1 Tax=Capnocytophaga sp. TaxID=44737 RepID=UPI0026DCB6BA|nr:hypothetical protein [Capnocytophaga sp.]MDO5105834.1 hypothetical protein [Capnocytophaga sp.]